MKTTSILVTLVLSTLFLSPAEKTTAVLQGEPQIRKAAQMAMNAGNFKDAYDQFHRLVLDPQTNPRQVPDDFGYAIRCLHRLNRVDETDALSEAVVKTHPGNWRLLQAVARSYMNGPHHGFIIAGEFRRGHHRGRRRPVNSAARDRARALQLMVQAMPLARQEGTGELIAGRPSNQQVLREVAGFFEHFARILLGGRGWREAWRLQYLTDLDVLPDYVPGWHRHHAGLQGAPVDEQGNPYVSAYDGGLLRIDADGRAPKRPYFRSRRRLDSAGVIHQGGKGRR